MPSVRLGDDTLFATIENPTDLPQFAYVSIRTIPGLWLRAAWEGTSLVQLAPQERRRVRLPFRFERLSSESTLRLHVDLTPGRSLEETGVARSVDFDTTIAITTDDPAVYDPARWFSVRKRPPLVLFAWKGSLAERDAERILGDRTRALVELVRWMDVDEPKRVHLVFFADTATKRMHTGHRGLGWGFDSTLVEVYNEEVQLDPYHELAHVVGARAGDPPAAFDEGFATYASERLGADALGLLGAPGERVDDVTCRFQEEERFIPLRQLMSSPDLASQVSDPRVAYPESASYVKFLIERHGISLFRRAYRSLAKTAPSDDNAERFARIYGVSLAVIEREWRARLRERCAAIP